MGVSFKHKSQVSFILTSFFQYVKTQFNKYVKILRTDNGTEFLNKELASVLSSLGIVHQKSCVYTPQQNGKVERKHRHLLNTARALRFHAHLPVHIWGDCILTATYLINRLPSTVLHGKSPYQVLFNEAPDYKHLRVFGSLCYASTAPKSTDKFASRATKCVMLGYPYGQNGYRVLDLSTKKVFISRNVQFIEHILPFKDVPMSVPSQLFPSSISSTEDPLYVLPISEISAAEHSEPYYTYNVPLDAIFTDVPPVVGSSDVPNASVTVDVPVSSRPSRQRSVPTKYSDYTSYPSQFVSKANTCVTFPESLAYDTFTPDYSHFIANVSKIPELVSYKQASQSSDWCTAMASKLAALEANDTWM